MTGTCQAGLLLAAALLALPGGDDPRNAAVWYRKAIARLDAIPLSEQQRQALAAYRGKGAATDEARMALAYLQPVFGAVRRAARERYCDFALDHAEGPALPVPHVGRLREIADLMVKDAASRLADGDAAGAVEDLSSLYRVTGHLSGDRLVISSLVAQAVFDRADRVVQTAIDGAHLDPSTAARLLGSLEGLHRNDPFDVAGALDQERESLLEWAAGAPEAPGGVPAMLQEIGADRDAASAVAALTLLDQEQFAVAIEQADAVNRRAVAALRLEDPAEARLELQQIGAEIARGEHGALALLLSPVFERLHERMVEARAATARRRAMLRAIASGDVAALELANAATWYLRAIERLESMSPPQRLAIAAAAAPGGAPGAREQGEALDEAQPIVVTLREGSRIARCDFSAARLQPFAIPPYLRGMREAGSLLRADAVRLLGEGRSAAAADRLAIAWRMSAHLAGDKLLASAAVAHAVFLESGDVVRGGVEGGAFGAAERAALREALGTGTRDPFGYRGAALRNAQDVRRYLNAYTPSSDSADAAARVGALDANGLFFALLVAQPPVPAAARAGDPPALLRLADPLPPEPLAAAMRLAEEVRERIESGDPASIFTATLPPLGLREKMESAPADLRRAQSLLREPG